MSEKKRRIIWWVLVSALFLAFLVFFFQKEEKEDLIKAFTGNEETDPGPELSTESETGYVFLTGAVAKEGIYAFSEGERLFELIEKTGGLLEDADVSRINLAEQVRDGTHVIVPRVGDSPDEAYGSESGLIDLNTAGKAELMTLPGIGEAKADAILAYRKKSGPFRSVEDLLQVSGIGEGILERIRGFIKV